MGVWNISKFEVINLIALVKEATGDEMIFFLSNFADLAAQNV